MRKSLWNQRIPTLLGLFLIIVSIGIIALLINREIITFGRADSTQNPDTVRITNITDTSFTVSYRTPGMVAGSVAYGKDKNFGEVALDDKDQLAGKAQNYQLHTISLKNLQPNTRYFFSITSGDGTFLNNGEPFTITTAPKNTNKPTQQKPITGKVINGDATAPTEAIVYLSIAGGQTLSTLAKSDGTFIIPLNTILTDTLSDQLKIYADTPLTLFIIDPSQQSNVNLTIKQSDPVPVVTLSQNYNFTVNTTPLDTEKSTQASQAAIARFPSFTATELKNAKSPQIVSPKKDEGFTDQQPLIRGSAPPNTEVKVIINSETKIESQVKSDGSGNWSYRPTTKLTPGQHTVSISARDNMGILKTITQSFTVYAEGTQVNQSATPSATPIITLTTPTIIPPIITTPTTIPTQIVLPSPTSIPTTKGGEPINPPGSSSLVTTGIGAILTIIVGILLFIFV